MRSSCSWAAKSSQVKHSWDQYSRKDEAKTMLNFFLLRMPEQSKLWSCAFCFALCLICLLKDHLILGGTSSSSSDHETYKKIHSLDALLNWDGTHLYSCNKFHYPFGCVKYLRGLCLLDDWWGTHHPPLAADILFTCHLWQWCTRIYYVPQTCSISIAVPAGVCRQTNSQTALKL